jgi:hypothetical protein
MLYCTTPPPTQSIIMSHRDGPPCTSPKVWQAVYLERCRINKPALASPDLLLEAPVYRLCVTGINVSDSFDLLSQSRGRTSNPGAGPSTHTPRAPSQAACIYTANKQRNLPYSLGKLAWRYHSTLMKMPSSGMWRRVRSL